MFIPLGDDVEKRNLPIVTSALILINVLIFAYQSRLFHEGGNRADVVAETFFSKWALIPSDLADGQVMGLLSHMFLHGDVMHILGNMIVFGVGSGHPIHRPCNRRSLTVSHKPFILNELGTCFLLLP